MVDMELNLYITYIRGDAGKSLARQRRKQTTATKLGIYSTCSTRSSLHLLARCSNFCKPLKNFQKVVRPTMSPRQQWPPRRTKNCDLSIVFFFQSREQVVVRRIGCVIKTLEAQVGLGCECPVSRGNVLQEQDPLVVLPAAFFLQNVLQLLQQRWVTFRADSLALWKMMNEEDAVLVPKNRGKNFSRVCVCVCEYVCVYIYTHTHTHTYIYAFPSRKLRSVISLRYCQI